MRIDKWQALGNDYLILAEAALPWDLTGDRVSLLCDVHQGLGADGLLLLSEPNQRGYVASLRIFNPDGSEAELSGNGAREAVLYLKSEGWTSSDEFSIKTKAGEIRATITGERSCRLAMGRARLAAEDFPGGPPDGADAVEAAGRRWPFQFVQVGNPQVSIEVSSADELAGLDLAAIGTAIESHERFPRRTNVSFYAVLGDGEIRARIFERGVGETRASGTGASGAAIAHVLRGGGSPVTVRLDGGALIVDVDESLLFSLAGSAEPVYRAELAEALLERLTAGATA